MRSQQLNENILNIYTQDYSPDLTGYIFTAIKIEKRDFFYIVFSFESSQQPAWTHRWKLLNCDIGIQIIDGIAPYLGEKVEKIEYNDAGIHLFLESTDFKIF